MKFSLTILTFKIFIESAQPYILECIIKSNNFIPELIPIDQFKTTKSK